MTKWLELDHDNLRTGTAKAVAHFMSFAKITCYLTLRDVINYSDETNLYESVRNVLLADVGLYIVSRNNIIPIH